MAILVAVGGAALGGMTGVGASVGWMVGSVVGSMLFPPDGTTSEGARLGDLAVSSSAYGAVRTIGFGTIRQSGNIIWSSGIREQKNTTKSGGKGMGGPSQTSITYTYFCDLAVAFGEGVADDVLRIWADGNLIFDKTSTNTATRMSGLSFRFYGGTDDQLPDSIIQSDKGADDTPAFRDTCYIVFDDLPLKNFGNRIPSITAEIAYQSTDAGAEVKSTQYSGGITSFSHGAITVDWNRQLAYVQSSSHDTLRRVNLGTMQEDRQVTGEFSLDQSSIVTEFYGGQSMVMPDGGIVVTVKAGVGLSNTEPIVRLDPNTLIETTRFGYSSSLGGWPNTAPLATMLAPISLYGLTGEAAFILCSDVFGADFGVLSYPDMDYVYDSDNFELDITGKIVNICGGKQGEGYGDGYLLTAPTAPFSGTTYVYRVRIDAAAVFDIIHGTSSGVDFLEVASFSVADLIPGETSLYAVEGLVYDKTDNTVIFGCKRNSNSKWVFVKVDPEDGSIIWRTEDLDGGPNYSESWCLSRVEDDTFGYKYGSFAGVQINTTTGEVLQSGTPPWAIEADGYNGFYDSRSESWVAITDSGENSLVGRWFFNRSEAEGETLGSVVQELCERVGLASTDLDITDLNSTILPGYAIGRQVTSRAAIETLTRMYLFDGVESDFLLKFLLRGQSSVRDITQEEMAYVSEDQNEVITETRTQEVELPQVFSITYMDKDNDYTQNTHSSKRIVQPEPSMYSSDTQNLSLALAIDADTAKQQAEKILFSTWVERTTYDYKLDWSHLDLDPTDVINITLDSGAAFRARIAQLDVGMGLAIEASALSEEEAQYTSAVQAYAGVGVPDQTVQAETATKIIIMDAPLLRDLDEPPSRVYSPLYYFMGGYADGQFSGGALYKSADEVAYEYEGTVVSDMSWGATGNALDDPPFDNPFATDTESTLTVFMQAGGDNIESVTTLQMLNGANAAAVIKNNGEIEIIQFREVTANSDGSFTLSHLLRGRRGTDTMSFNHTAGELFLLLVAAEGQIHSLTLAELNAIRYYRGVGNGQLVEEAERTTLTSKHRPLMPYAPVGVSTVVDGSDIDISWVRRTRVGGALIDYIGDVPLSEDSEEYELEIYDGPAGTLLRTATGISTEEYTYTSANITTDFGSIPDQLTLKVYQISAQVDRGFTYEVTTNVE